jgi:BirA family biotin operon repressor/biotin-[acetyl-CoA-carboxylase] ligase
MVWKHIKTLEREGFGIEAVPSQGYRIVSAPDTIRLDDLRRGFKTMVIGRDIQLLPTAVSTNTRAMELAATGAADGTVVIAETQTGGKGRLGRTWISPRGNLYLSVILRPDIPMHKAPLITLMGAVAVASSIRETLGLAAGIKWPNDILIAGKKVCGLLTEMSAEQDRIRHVVLGIGIDVNMPIEELPPVIRALTTTLAAEAGRTIDRTVFLRTLLVSLDHEYHVFLKDPAAVLREWESFNVTIGNRVAISGAGESIEGLAQGIDPEGRLIIKQDDGSLHTVAAGDVTILKGSGVK